MLNFKYVNYVFYVYMFVNGCTSNRSSNSDLRANKNTLDNLGIFYAKPIEDKVFDLKERIPVLLL